MLLGDRPGALVRPSALILAAEGRNCALGQERSARVPVLWFGAGVGTAARLPTPRFCANLHILGLCRAERGGWYGCTWLTGLRLSSCEPRVARKGRSVQVHVVGRLPTPRFCANLHILGLCRAERGGRYRCTWLTGLRRSSREPRVPERGGRYRCTWLDACLPPGSVPTPTFWDPGPRNSSAPTCRGRACSQSTAEKLVSHRIGCIRGLRLPPAEALPYIWRSSAGVASASPSPAIVRAFSPR